MRSIIKLTTATAIALAIAIPAVAQTTVGVGVTVAPEERTRIKEYVVKEKVPAVRMQQRVSVGAKLPADVELRPVPSQWGPTYSKYRYIYSDDQVYLVEPSSREVLTVID